MQHRRPILPQRSARCTPRVPPRTLLALTLSLSGMTACGGGSPSSEGDGTAAAGGSGSTTGAAGAGGAQSSLDSNAATQNSQQDTSQTQDVQMQDTQTQDGQTQQDATQTQDTQMQATPAQGTDAQGTAPLAAGDCTFDVSGEQSETIPTVGIINWTTDLQGLNAAHIDFWRQDPTAKMTAPANLEDNGARTLLLGMKGNSTYTYQVVAEGDGQECASQEYTIDTGAVPTDLPALSLDVRNAAAVAPGFMILSSGIGGGGGGPGGGMMASGGTSYVYIIDSQGDVVWWAASPNSTSRARMDWEGNNMWMLSLNVGNTGSAAVRRVSMDGQDVESNVEGLSDLHHDFAVVPGGIVAGPSWTSDGQDPPSDLIERAPDGSITTVVRLDSSIYNSNSYHANSIHFHPSDNAYTVSDRNPNLYVKVSRDGELIWQLGGNNPVGASFTGSDLSWSVNHGHHFTSDNHFLIFNNSGMGGGQTGGGPMGGFGGGNSLVLEFLLDENAMTADLVWQYDGGVGSGTLGDVQRLDNGNTLVTYSNSGTIHEVDANGELVQAITSSGSFGYTQHRPSLYGPPPKSR